MTSFEEETDRPLTVADCDFGVPAPAVGVALSGGPDSMVLVWLLSQWAKNNGTQIHALTVDHGLRPEAAAEAAQVGQWVKGWAHIRHEILKLDKALDDSRIMESARNARYKILSAYCRRKDIEKLFVAHHRDDQAETFLFRLAKGSGLDGLAAMRRESVKEGLRIIRPFLDVPKSHLIATCRAQEIPFVEDPTNDDARYARPRMRQSSDILAAEGLTPKRLAVTAARLARARDALEHYAAAALEKNLKEEDTTKILLDYTGLKSEPAEIRLRVILMIMKKLVPDEDGYGPRREKIEELAVNMFSGQKFQRQTLGGCIFSRDKDIVIEREGS